MITPFGRVCTNPAPSPPACRFPAHRLAPGRERHGRLPPRLAVARAARASTTARPALLPPWHILSRPCSPGPPVITPNRSLPLLRVRIRSAGASLHGSTSRDRLVDRRIAKYCSELSGSCGLALGGSRPFQLAHVERMSPCRLPQGTPIAPRGTRAGTREGDARTVGSGPPVNAAGRGA